MQKGCVPELIKVDSAVAVSIEHANHHAHGVRIKLGPVAVDEGVLQLGLAQLAALVAVDGLEQRPQRVAVVGVARRRRRH